MQAHMLIDKYIFPVRPQMPLQTNMVDFIWMFIFYSLPRNIKWIINPLFVHMLLFLWTISFGFSFNSRRRRGERNFINSNVMILMPVS